MKAVAVAFVVAVCLLAPIQACTTTSPVNLDGVPFPLHPMTIAGWTQCYTNTAMYFDAAKRTTAGQLMDAIETAVRLHSTTDLSKSYSQTSPRPFSINTDVLARLAAIRNSVTNNNTYSTLTWFDDLLNAVNSQNDAHSSFIRPSVFRGALQLAPFGVTLAKNASGGIEVRMVRGFIPPAQFTATFGGPAFETHVNAGATVLSINGVPALQYLRNYAASLTGLFRDPITRLNAALGPRGTWARREIEKLPTAFHSGALSYVIRNGGSTVSLDITHGLAFALQIPDATSLAAQIWGSASGSGKRNLGQTDVSNAPIFIQFRYGTPQTGSCVLRVASFLADRTAISQYRSRLQDAITICIAAGYKNLIIDVSNNDGGSPAAAQVLANLLVEPWNKNPLPSAIAYDTAFQVFDIPVNSKWVDFFNAQALNNSGNDGLWPNENYRNPVNGDVLLPTGFLSGPLVNVGPISRNLSQPGLFYGKPDLPGFQYTALSPQVFFDKIIIMSNGICGSSCGQFINIMRANDRARVVYVGGLPNEPADPGSYPGGARYDYLPLRNQLSPAAQAVLPLYPWLNTIALTFNGWQSYRTCASYYRGEAPADMVVGNYDARIDFWDYVYDPIAANITLADTQKTASNPIFAAVNAFFPQMPINLTRLARPRFQQTSCAVDAPFYPEAFSTVCRGRWEDLSVCNRTCGTGYKDQVYNVYITADNSCTIAHGTRRTTECNTQPCECRQERARSSLCRASCIQETALRNLPESGPCPQPEGTSNGTRVCSGEFCAGSQPAAGFRGAILPVLHCIELVNPNTRTYGAYFGYNNENAVAYTIAAGEGNKFDVFNPTITPAGALPTSFSNNFNPFQFRADFPDQQTPIWIVDGRREANANSGPFCPSERGTSITAFVFVEVAGAFTYNQAGLFNCIKNDMGVNGDELVVSTPALAPSSWGVYQINVTLSYNANDPSQPTPARGFLNLGRAFSSKSPYVTGYLGSPSCGNFGGQVRGAFLKIEDRFSLSANRPANPIPIGGAIAAPTVSSAVSVSASALLAFVAFVLHLIL